MNNNQSTFIYAAESEHGFAKKKKKKEVQLHHSGNDNENKGKILMLNSRLSDLNLMADNRSLAECVIGKSIQKSETVLKCCVNCVHLILTSDEEASVVQDKN